MNVKKAVENQSMIFNILKQSKNHDRLSHAYLFYGDEGVGKKEMAYALACLLYCPNGGCLECDVWILPWLIRAMPGAWEWKMF